MNTLPELAARWQANLDRVRELVRNNPALKSLGTRVGGTRVFSDADAERIREALKAKATATAAK